MWIYTWANGMSDEVADQVRGFVDDVPPIALGECSTWLNLNTGAQFLHVDFGGHRAPGRSHGVYYRSPAGELLDMTLPVAHLLSTELDFLPEEGEERERYRAINIYRWRKVDHDIEKTLKLREGEFEEQWPGSNP